MANQKTRLYNIVIKADSTQLTKLRKRFKELGMAAKVSGKKVDDSLGKNTKKTKQATSAASALKQKFASYVGITSGVAAVTLAIAALSLGLKKSIDNFSRWEDNMGKVGTLLTSTSFESAGAAKNFEQLNKIVLNMATESSVALHRIPAALFDIISATEDAAGSSDVLAASMKLAVAGAADLKVATDGVTSILNAYGLAASEAEDVSRTLFIAQRAGKTTVGKLAAGIGKVVAEARQLGVSYKEVSAALAAVTKSGVRTDEAITSLAATFMSIKKATQVAKDEAKKLGVEFSSQALRDKGLARFLKDIGDSAYFSAESMELLIGSRRAAKAAFALMGAQADDFRRILSELNDEVKAGTDYNRAYADKSDDLANVSRNLNNNIQALQISFAELTKDSLANFSKSLVKAIKSTKKFIDEERILSEVAKDQNEGYKSLDNTLEGVGNSGKKAYNVYAMLMDAANGNWANVMLRWSGALTNVRDNIEKLARSSVGFIDQSTVFGKTVNAWGEETKRTNYVLADQGVKLDRSVLFMEQFAHATIGATKASKEKIFVDKFLNDLVGKSMEVQEGRISALKSNTGVERNLVNRIVETWETGIRKKVNSMLDEKKAHRDKLESIKADLKEEHKIYKDDDRLSTIGEFLDKDLALRYAHGLRVTENTYDRLRLDRAIRVDFEKALKKELEKTLESDIATRKKHKEALNKLTTERFATDQALQHEHEEYKRLMDVDATSEELLAVDNRIAMLELKQADHYINYLQSLGDFETNKERIKKAHEERQEKADKVRNSKILKNNDGFYKTWKSQITGFKSYEESTNRERVQNMRSTLGTIATLQNQNNKTLFFIGKAAAVSMATIDGIAAVQKALAAAPPPWNFALASLVGVATAANIAKIVATKPPAKARGDFNQGGIVGTSAGLSDNAVANVRTGEAILNNAQQSRLLALADGRSSASNSDSVVEELKSQTETLKSYIQQLIDKPLLDNTDIFQAASDGSLDVTGEPLHV